MARYRSADFSYPPSKRSTWYTRQQEAIIKEFELALPDTRPRGSLDAICHPDFEEYARRSTTPTLIGRRGLKAAIDQALGQPYDFGKVVGLYIPKNLLPIFPGTGERCDIGALVSSQQAFVRPAYLRGAEATPYEPRHGESPVFQVVTNEALALSEDGKQVIGRVTEVVGATSVGAALRKQHQSYHDGQRGEYIDLRATYEDVFGTPR